MCDLPGPGLDPVSPALADRFLTTAPPRKPHSQLLISLHCPRDWAQNPLGIGRPFRFQPLAFQPAVREWMRPRTQRWAEVLLWDHSQGLKLTSCFLSWFLVFFCCSLCLEWHFLQFCLWKFYLFSWVYILSFTRRTSWISLLDMSSSSELLQQLGPVLWYVILGL